jgi:hypothetical protein
MFGEREHLGLAMSWSFYLGSEKFGIVLKRSEKTMYSSNGFIRRY